MLECPRCGSSRIVQCPTCKLEKFKCSSCKYVAPLKRFANIHA